MGAREDLEVLFEQAGKVPRLMARLRELADGFDPAKVKASERAYEKTHWGRTAPRGQRGAQTEAVDAPDPRSGVTELGELWAVEYVTSKGKERGDSIYRHEFDDEHGGRIEKLPVLGFTAHERPSGLVIIRRDSVYTVTPHGIEH